MKEAVLFRDFEEQLRPYLPRSLGVYLDHENSYTLRLEERLAEGSVILDPDDDTTDKSQPSFSGDTLSGIARIHTRFYGNYDQLIETGYFFDCNTEVMTRATDLWQALADFIANNCPETVTPFFAPTTSGDARQLAAMVCPGRPRNQDAPLRRRESAKPRLRQSRGWIHP